MIQLNFGQEQTIITRTNYYHLKNFDNVIREFSKINKLYT